MNRNIFKLIVILIVLASSNSLHGQASTKLKGNYFLHVIYDDEALDNKIHPHQNGYETNNSINLVVSLEQPDSIICYYRRKKIKLEISEDSITKYFTFSSLISNKVKVKVCFPIQRFCFCFKLDYKYRYVRISKFQKNIYLQITNKIVELE